MVQIQPELKYRGPCPWSHILQVASLAANPDLVHFTTADFNVFVSTFVMSYILFAS